MSQTYKSLLLDTHILIWLINGDSTCLNKKSVKLINAHAETGSVYISAISLWEIGNLAKKNRIKLNIPLEQINDSLESTAGINFLSISPRVAVESTQLPGELHKDPADRILIATARLDNMTLFTRDERIHSYANYGFVQVVEV